MQRDGQYDPVSGTCTLPAALQGPGQFNAAAGAADKPHVSSSHPHRSAELVAIDVDASSSSVRAGFSHLNSPHGQHQQVIGGASGGITWGEVARHCSQQSCWLVIGGKVWYLLGAASWFSD